MRALRLADNSNLKERGPTAPFGIGPKQISCANSRYSVIPVHTQGSYTLSPHPVQSVDFSPKSNECDAASRHHHRSGFWREVPTFVLVSAAVLNRLTERENMHRPYTVFRIGMAVGQLKAGKHRRPRISESHISMKYRP